MSPSFNWREGGGSGIGPFFGERGGAVDGGGGGVGWGGGMSRYGSFFR